MYQRFYRRLLRPETLTALGIILVASLLLIPATDLRWISALLPVAMLSGLVVLATVLLLLDQRSAARGEEAKSITVAPTRVIGAFMLIFAYALATDYVGFYPTTAVSVPLVAFIFGYRGPLGLAIATAVVLGAIWLIFDYAMSQQFPSGQLWEEEY